MGWDIFLVTDMCLVRWSLLFLWYWWWWCWWQCWRIYSMKKLIKWNQMNLFQPEHLSKKHKDERMANAMPCHDYKVESCLILHIWTLSSLFLMLLRISHIQISTSVSYLLQSDFGISRKVKKWPCSLFKHNEFLSDSSPIIGYPCQ